MQPQFSEYGPFCWKDERVPICSELRQKVVILLVKIRSHMYDLLRDLRSLEKPNLKDAYNTVQAHCYV